jgi:2-polyprenyl-6-methoxyphenol hydroxylase-like FAD-dependent oxidoreductase
MPPQNILIVGCSIAGPTFASFLLLSPLPVQEKPRITILEQAPSLRPQGQNIDIRTVGVAIMRKLGIESAVRAAFTGEEGVQFVDSQNRVWGGAAADKTGSSQTPTSDIEILRGSLAKICYQQCKKISGNIQAQGGAGVEFIFGDTLDELAQDGDRVQVRLAKSQQRRTFDLVVGADGLQSLTRRLAWGKDGEPSRLHKLDMYSAFFSIPRGPTDTTWRRWYHAAGRRGIMLRPDQQNNRTTISISIINDKDPRFSELATTRNVKAQKELIAEYFHDAGWESKRVLQEMHTAADFYYDMVAQVKLDRLSKGRVVLLGDAAYCPSFITGQGTTLAFTGAYHLAGSLTQHPENITHALSLYEEKMRPIVDRAQKLPPGMPYLMHPETEWGVWALLLFAWGLNVTRVAALLFWLFGPGARQSVEVEDYGFEVPQELEVVD